MFSLSVVDHVRLNFGHAVQNYTIHARAAERLADLALKARFVMFGLLGLGTIASLTALITTGRTGQMTAAIASVLALIGYAVYVALGFEVRVYTHRAFAHRLWRVCEDYRALLAEVQDDALDRAAVLKRRDELIGRVHAIYEQGFPIDQQAFERARLAPDGTGTGLTEQQIDQYLPASMRAGASRPETVRH
jgi:hypothetical protein